MICLSTMYMYIFSFSILISTGRRISKEELLEKQKKVEEKPKVLCIEKLWPFVLIDFA